MSEQQQPSNKLILHWESIVPEGYVVTATDEGTHTMVVVPVTENNGQDKAPCPV